MRPIGFSTGALAHGDFLLALEMLVGCGANAVELSALREHELEPLLGTLGQLDLGDYEYVSFHAPSHLFSMEERRLVDSLERVAELGWPIVLHADVPRELRLWKRFGDLLCIENLDKRKPTGRCIAELRPLLDTLPDASVCFDIGHARQIDPTMHEARMLLLEYGHRIQQLHVSEVNSRSQHESLTLMAMLAYRAVADVIPPEIPVILETPVSRIYLSREMEKARRALSTEWDSILSPLDPRARNHSSEPGGPLERPARRE